MSDYRIYRLNQEGRIVYGAPIMARDDDDAMRRAADEMGAASAVEVWQLARRIGRVDAGQAPQLR